MTRHPFDSDFRATPEQKIQFQRDGCVKLDGFLNGQVLHMLRDLVDVEMQRETINSTTPPLYRANYALEGDRRQIFELLACRYFRQALTDLTDNDLFFTGEQIFEVEQNADIGSTWHVGVDTFGYQVSTEFGCTLWAPLQPVNARGQRGGLAYVPQHVISGEWVFDQIEPAVVSALEAKERAGVKTNTPDYVSMKRGVLNSPAMLEILESLRVEEDFEPGDVLLFNKMVVHRGVALEEGPLAKRAAYAMRFVDARSHYDLRRARNVEYPVQKYRTGLFAYKPFTRQPIEMAEAGAADGDLIAECAYFSERDRRMLRRERRSDSA